MFKNLTVLRIIDSVKATQVILNEKLARKHFRPCEGAEAFKFGFLPHSDTGTYVRSIAGNFVFNFVMEKKTVPTKLVKARVEEMKQEYRDKAGGIKPSKAEVAAMKDNAIMELLPRAFPNRTEAIAWINTKTMRLFIDTSSPKVAESLVVALRDAYPDLPACHQINTAKTPSTMMTEWVLEPDVANFTVDDRCELVMPVEGKPTIKYSNHTLTGEEIISYIQDGRIVVSLGLTYRDRLSLLLTEKFVVKSIKLSEVIKTEFLDNEEDWAGQFTIVAADLESLVDDLVAAMGGELEQGANDELEDEEQELAA